MKVLKCEGPRYALVEWHITCPIPTVWEASDDIAAVFAAVAEHVSPLSDGDRESLSVVKVHQWFRARNDASNTFPTPDTCTHLATIEISGVADLDDESEE